jgi:hypothetical protein
MIASTGNKNLVFILFDLKGSINMPTILYRCSASPVLVAQQNILIGLPGLSVQYNGHDHQQHASNIEIQMLVPCKLWKEGPASTWNIGAKK